MRWFRNLPQAFRRLWKERQASVLAGALLLWLAAIFALGWIIGSQGEHELIRVLRIRSEAQKIRSEATQREAEHGSAETSTDASTQLDKTLDEWAELASKRWLTPEEYKAAYKHLVHLIGVDQHYIGPQTADALMVFTNLRPENRHEFDDLKAHFQRMLDRGVVFQDQWDILGYGGGLMDKLQRAYKSDFAKDIFEMHGVSEGSWAELEEAIIERELRTWPITSEQFRHAFDTDEGTVNLYLDPETGAIGMAVVGDPVPKGSERFTPEEKYKMTRYGIAPKGYRLRFVNNLWDSEELAPDEVPFFSERQYVKDLSRDSLNDLLRAIPSLMSRPEAQDLSDVDWMSMVDRYEAALEELASRGYVPEPFADRKPPPLSSSPSGAVRSSAAPPGAAPAPVRPSVERRESAPPIEARNNEAAIAEAEKRQYIAEAFLAALEKEAKKAKITPEDRSLIARRLRELRIMKNPDLLKPPTPSQQQPAQDSGGEDEEE